MQHCLLLTVALLVCFSIYTWADIFGDDDAYKGVKLVRRFKKLSALNKLLFTIKVGNVNANPKIAFNFIYTIN